jgi:hypothetical protein
MEDQKALGKKALKLRDTIERAITFIDGNDPAYARSLLEDARKSADEVYKAIKLLTGE